MIVDTHVHIFSCKTYEQELDKLVHTREDGIALRTRHPDICRARYLEPALDNSDQLIATMDKHGIKMSLIQCGRGPGNTNEHVAEVVRKHPGRLAGLVRIRSDELEAGYLDDPAPLRQKAPDIIAHGIENLGLVGVGELLARALTRSLHPEEIARELKPVFDVLAHYKAPIQIMTAYTQFKGSLYWGNPIWVDEIAANHPDVPIILTKMGRGIGYYFDTTMTVAMRNENVYLDTVQTTGEHLRKALDALGPHRILFGTDWGPVWNRIKVPTDNHTTCLQLLDAAGVSPDEREAILWKNAARLFKLDLG